MYIIDNYIACETAEETAEYIIDRLSDEPYDDMLDELYGEIDICGYTYSASVALYRLDRTAYECGKNDYYNSLCYDIAEDLKQFECGYGCEDTFYDFHVIYSEDEEEEDDE